MIPVTAFSTFTDRNPQVHDSKLAGSPAVRVPRPEIAQARNVAEPRRGGGMNTDFSLDENARTFNTRSKTRARGVRSPIPSPATKVSAAAAKQ
jgi:hypothetical protein